MGFVCPHVTSMVGAAMIFTSLVFQMVSMAAPGWFFVRIGEKGDAMVGLWEYCHSEPKYKCTDFSDQWEVKSWLEASRAFSILASLTLIVSSVSVMMMCVLSQLQIFFTIAPLSSLIAALFIFIEFSAFAGEVEKQKNTIGQEFEYRYCFALTITAFIMSLFASILFCCGNSRRKNPQAENNRMEYT